MSANEQPTKWPRTNRLAAALEWQQGRARLLPLHWIREDGRCSCGKGDCGSPGKHPIASAAPHGVNDAVSDREEIEAWWTRYPEANIGVAVGDLFVVLDVDDRAGGDEELSRLEALHGALPDTPEAQTGGGGRHVFFAPDERFRNSGSVIAPGIDTKGQGGYIVGAGSNHATGGTYEHDAALRWGEMPLAPVPGWILEALTGPRAARPRLPEVIRKSQRNPHLWREACNLVRRGWQADEIVTALLALNERCDPPGERAYVEALARRARATYAPAGAMALTAADAAQGACVLAPRPVKAVYPLTDVGNRDRLVDRHGHRLRYCAPLGHYLVWDGVVWRHAVAGEVVELAIETIDALPDTERGMHMVPGRKEGDEEDALPRWVKASQAAARIDAMVRLAQSHPDLQVGVDDLDQFPWLLTVENGTVDLLTGRLLPSDPAHLITLQAPVRFDPQAKAPRFCQFIHEVFGGREPLVRFAQEFIGYCLTGATSEAVMLILHGQGSNGKSILLEVLAHVLGPYAREAAPTAFVAARNVDAARNDLAALRGARFVSAAETSDSCRLDMSVIKRVTGGDAITARFLHQEFFSYRPQFKLLMATNHEPEVTSGDRGTWRRLLKLPFLVQFGQPGFPPAENKDHLTTDLKAEAPGILNWALEGCRRWMALGLSRPIDVVAATEDYEEEQDVLADFMSECVEVHPSNAAARVSRRDLYNRYVEWAESNHIRPLGVKGFGQRLKARGVTGSRSHSVTYWDGLRLTIGGGQP